LVGPSEPFATRNAMERNAAIFAAACAAVVVQPRLGQGGTWHGANAALRRRETPLAVFPGSTDPDVVRASRALAMGGAVLLTSVEHALEWLKDPRLCSQPKLFAA
jgi:predicted Rossmann fold nucleotide-binding protein DprA/Smf involved in DNA uptake